MSPYQSDNYVFVWYATWQTSAEIAFYSYILILFLSLILQNEGLIF